MTTHYDILQRSKLVASSLGCMSSPSEKYSLFFHNIAFVMDRNIKMCFMFEETFAGRVQ